MNYLVVGLGNPGNKYKNTRHNVGFLVVEECARTWSAGDFTKSGQAEALTAKTSVAGQNLQLVKPQTFMNKSGRAIKTLVDYFEVPLENILVVHDDVDLGLGRLKIVHDRGAGGHRGVQSVVDELGSTEFVRLRIGISPTDEGGAVDKQTVPGKGVNPFVMGEFSQAERDQLEAEVYEATLKGVKRWIKDGLEAAMNVTN